MFKVYLSYLSIYKYLLTKDNAGEKSVIIPSNFLFYEKHMLYRWVYNTWALLSGKKSMQKGRLDCHHSYTKLNCGVRKIGHSLIQKLNKI